MRPRILVALQDDHSLLSTLVDMANAWGWDLLDYTLLRGAYPKNVHPSGAIVHMLPDDPLVQHLREINCPVVRFGCAPHPLDHTMPAVLPDVQVAGNLAAQHFLERGFQHAAYIGWQPACKSKEFYGMFAAFRGTLSDAGVDVHSYSLGDFYIAGESPDARSERLQRELGGWLRQLPKPIGIFGYNDRLMAHLCTFFQLQGGHVPEEVAMLGYGNTTWCERSPVSLSSIAAGRVERGRRAMHLLRSLMEGDPPPEKPIFVPPAGLIKRRSTDILAMSDILVAQSLIFIWEHIQDNISVEDVAHSVGLSDRQLGRRFQQAIGRSVNQEIVRRRIEEVKRLLRADNRSIADIAKLTGYRSARYLHYAFQKNVGMTPGQYRDDIQS